MKEQINTGVVTPKEEKDPKIKPIPRANAKKWREKIQRSKRVMKQFKEEAQRFQRMYKGDYSDRPGKKRRFEQMNVNIVYSHVEIITPAVNTGFPFIKVRPKPKVGVPYEQANDAARNMELCVNYWLKELAIDEELSDVFFDTFFSHAGVELGWETEIEEKVPVYLDEQGAEQPGSEIVVLKDQPFIVRRDPWCIIMDPDARRRKEGRWMSIEEIIPFNDFLASPKWTDKAKQKCKPQMYPVDVNTEQAEVKEDMQKGDKEWIRIWTIWDKDCRKVYSVTDGYDGWVNTDDPEGVDWPYELEYKQDTFPICVHDAKRDLQSPYTWSEFRAYESQIVELNRIRSAAQIHVKRSLPKYIYTDAFGTRADVSKLMNARSDEAVKVNNLDAMRPLEEAKLPTDLYNFGEVVKDDLLNVSGLFEYQNQSIADTATEASLINSRSQIRKSMRSRAWEQFVVEVAAKLAQLCQQNMNTSIAVEIAGPNGLEWLNVNKEQIQGEFIFDIEPGIMEYKNEAMRTQQLLKFAEISANNPHANSRVILQKLAKNMDISPDEVVVPLEQMPPPQPPEPNIKFANINPTEVTDPNLQMAIINAALQQNGVQPQGGIQGGTDAPLPPVPQGPMPPMPTGMDLMGGNPNGNMNLPPVEGNLTDLSAGGVGNQYG